MSEKNEPYYLVKALRDLTMTDTKLRFQFESFLEKCKEVHELVDWGEKEDKGDGVLDMEIGLTLPIDGTDTISHRN